jgi:hypothetical protein
MAFLVGAAESAPQLFPRQLDPEQRKRNEHRERCDRESDDPPRVLAPPDRLPADLRPEHDQARDRARNDHEHGRKHGRSFELEVEQPNGEQDEPGDDETGEK